MKSFTIEIDNFGNVTTNLKGYEGQSPELAAIVEEASGGKVQEKKWAPGAHAHVINGKTVTHTH